MGYKRTGKIEMKAAVPTAIGLAIISIGGMILGGWSLVDFAGDGDYWRMTFVSLPVVGLFGASLIYILRLRVTVDDFYVEKRAFRTVQLHYQDINRVEFVEFKMILRSMSGKIEITKEVADQALLFDAITSRLQHRGDVEVTGDEESIEAYFGDRA